jgi:hypothetical protein
LKYNPLDISYFSHDDRKGESKNFEFAIEEVFQLVYGKQHSERNQQKKMNRYENSASHPLFQKILEFIATPVKQLDGESAKCDEVFADYIIKMARYCNPTFFIRLLKFVTLFRECVNIINREKCKPEVKEFAEVSNAEDVPDISNEFITEFLDPDQNCFEFSKDEAIDITQNLCHWLYENNFTCSKLSLISNY